MEFSEIDVQVDGPRGDITLNRPAKLNPLSTTTLNELVAAARHLDTLPSVKVVVVAGSGRAFSAGADLASFATAGGQSEPESAPSSAATVAREAADAGRRMAEAIEAMNAVDDRRSPAARRSGWWRRPTATCASPQTTPASRSPRSTWASHLPGEGIPRLVREIGPARTKELVMTCRPFGAAEALAAGFLNRAVPASDLTAAVDELIGQLTAKSALTLTATKRHTNAVTESMVGTARAWNDADSLVTALRDPGSRAAGAAYLKGLGRG